MLNTTVLTSDPPGAVITTFLAPPACKCFSAAALVAKKPVASRTISTPSLAQSICSGSRSAETLTNLPLTSNPPSLTSTVPSKRP